MDAPTPHQALAGHLVAALRALRSQRSSFDVACIYLPHRWTAGFEGGADEDFNLHDHVKAAAAELGIPVQIVLESGALAYRCRASVAWRLSLALYVKAGGVPWVIAEREPATAYVGISYALRASGPRRFVTCCSQIFDDDGTGLEFIAYEVDGARISLTNPFLSRDDMRRVMTRTCDLYRRRHAGRMPQRIIVHKSSRFLEEEVNGAFDALDAVAEIELVQVQGEVPWFGVQVDAQPGRREGRAGAYPCLRGTVQPIGRDSVLIWTQGNAPEAATAGRNYFKEKKAVPHPLMLQRFSGSGGWDATARRVLALTKMNWNNDGLYDRLPTTMRYASTLARVAKMGFSAGRTYAFRHVM
ncbi:MAG TPA: Piwi domain-containing protein [Actinomycetota bacterium]|nr:Piwi domain-containing protein [Actinomycetota bacterium]